MSPFSLPCLLVKYMYKASTLWVTFPEPECVVPKFYWVNIWKSYSLSTILNPCIRAWSERVALRKIFRILQLCVVVLHLIFLNTDDIDDGSDPSLSTTATSANQLPRDSGQRRWRGRPLTIIIILVTLVMRKSTANKQQRGKQG